jgi:hypothetical protein
MRRGAGRKHDCLDAAHSQKDLEFVRVLRGHPDLAIGGRSGRIQRTRGRAREARLCVVAMSRSSVTGPIGLQMFGVVIRRNDKSSALESDALCTTAQRHGRNDCQTPKY